MQMSMYTSLIIYVKLSKNIPFTCSTSQQSFLYIVRLLVQINVLDKNQSRAVSF